MRLALVNNQRMRPFKGGRGECLICLGPVYARTEYTDGTSPHWAHMPKYELCDTWHESETEWHREWKDQFPEEWQEIRMQDEFTGEFHQADVQTDKGIIIEFQNSPISLQEIRARENFYGKLIWVVNVIPFKEKFKLFSEVKTKLREVESSNSRAFVEYREELDKDRETYLEKIKALKKEAEGLVSTSLKNRIELHKKFTNELPKYSLDIYNYLISEHTIEWELIEFVDSISSIKTQIKETINEIALLNEKKSNSNKILNSFYELPVTERGSKSLKELSPKFIYFTEALKYYWEKVTVVYKLNTKPVTYSEQPITGQFQVERFLTNPHQYGYLIDDEPIILKHSNLINDNQKKIESLSLNLSNYKDKIQEELKKWLEGKIGKLESDLEKKIQLHTAKLKEIEVTEKEHENAKERDDIRLDNFISELELSKKKERYRVMKFYKRLYKFDLRIRKIWYQSECEVFFDTGEDLFRIVRQGVVKKYTKDIFLRKYSIPFCSLEDKMNRIYSMKLPANEKK